VPVADPVVEASRRRVIVSGEVPSATNPPLGCRFHTRCPHAFVRCRAEVPQLRDLGDGQAVACHLQEAKRMTLAKISRGTSRQNGKPRRRIGSLPSAQRSSTRPPASSTSMG